MTQSTYSEFYITTLFGISLLCCYYLSSYKGDKHLLPPIPTGFTALLCILLILGIACCPGGWGSDKWRYETMFVHAEELSFTKDIFWQYYNLLANYLLGDVFLFFLFTAAFYVLSNYQFVRTYVDKDNRMYLLLLMAVSLGFYGYGMNTIRAGVALGFFLLALSKRNNVTIFVILSVFSVGFHKSLLIPLAAYLLSSCCKQTKYYLYLWIAMLICSALNITIVSDFIQSSFSEYDNRVSEYLLATKSKLYVKAGFRVDFIVYSLFPIVIGYYYIFKRNFVDSFYIRIFNTYLIINSFWLLIIRIPFTDRFAYLSWFLTPFILAYPLLQQQILKGQVVKLSGIIFIMASVNFILSVMR